MARTISFYKNKLSICSLFTMGLSACGNPAGQNTTSVPNDNENRQYPTID